MTNDDKDAPPPPVVGGGGGVDRFLDSKDDDDDDDDDADAIVGGEAAYDAVDDEDIESLAARACALASVPVPDYADAIGRANARSRLKYGNRFTLDDDDDDDDDEAGTAAGMAADLDEEGRDRSSALAERTSQILSNFQEYVAGIGFVDGGGGGGGGGGGSAEDGHAGAEVHALPVPLSQGPIGIGELPPRYRIDLRDKLCRLER